MCEKVTFPVVYSVIYCVTEECAWMEALKSFEEANSILRLRNFIIQFKKMYVLNSSNVAMKRGRRRRSWLTEQT